jgi:molybdopterin converting factor subunit 1
MKLTIQMFAVARDLAGAASVEVEVPEGATVGDVRAALIARVPGLAAMQKHLMFAVNADYAQDTTFVPMGAEVACIPPVSGG